MNIAILIDLLVPGGVQKAAIEETHHLKAMGHDVQLFCLTRTKYDYQYKDLLRDLNIQYLSDLNPSPFRKTIKLPFFAFLTTNHLLCPIFARRYSKLANFDLIVSHGTTTCLTALATKKTLNIPFTAFIWDPMEFILHKVYKDTPLQHFFPLFDMIIRHLQNRIFKTASQVLTPSRVHQRTLKKIYKVSATIIPPGHDFSPKKISKKPTYILGYSRWQKEKHPEFFLRLARKTNLPIVVAGLWTNPHELETFKSQVNGEKLNIKIIKKVTNKDIPRIAAGAIVWVHPNFEAFGMPGLELAAHGVPIIIPQGSGVTELFEDGVHGFFPPRRNWQAMIRAVKKVVNDKKLATKMGQAAAQAAEQYTWKSHARNLAQILKKQLSQPSSTVILHNSFVTTKSIGGGDRFMIEIAKRLKKFKLTVITPKIGHYHWKESGVKDIRFKLLPSSALDGHESPLVLFFAYLLRSIQTIKLLGKLTKHDIIISTNELVPEILPAYWYKKTHPTARWISRIFHLIPSPRQRVGNFFVNTAAFLLQRTSLYLMRSSDRILVDNPRLRDQLTDSGIPYEKIEIHCGGVNIEQIRSYKPEPNQETFSAVYIGRLNPHKGIFDLVPIWKKVTKILPDAKLGVAGDGPAHIKKKLKAMIRVSGLSRNIKLLGFLPHRKGKTIPLLDVLKNSKLLIFPDHEAGFGLIVVEAMASGVPVVAYSLPIFGETHKQGFVTAPLGDTKIYSKNIIKLLSDEKYHKIMSQKASAQAKEFSWEKATLNFSKLIQPITGINA